MIKRWIINVIDRSDSMISLKNVVISEYNMFLNKTKKNINDIRWTLIMFNDDVNILHDDSITNILDLQDRDYFPQTGTALLDAIGKACIHIINNTVEYNDIIMNIFTDGIENSSKNYTYVSVNELLKSIKNKHNLNINFYCTSSELLNISSRIPSLDTIHINATLQQCTREINSNSHFISEHRSAPISCPQCSKV